MAGTSARKAPYRAVRPESSAPSGASAECSESDSCPQQRGRPVASAPWRAASVRRGLSQPHSTAQHSTAQHSTAAAAAAAAAAAKQPGQRLHSCGTMRRESGRIIGQGPSVMHAMQGRVMRARATADHRVLLLTMQGRCCIQLRWHQWALPSRGRRCGARP
jgi:hypothetical protein